MTCPSALKCADAAPTASGRTLTSETFAECVGAAEAGAAATSAAANASARAVILMAAPTPGGPESGGEYTAAPNVLEGPGRQSRRDRDPHHPRARGARHRLGG